MKKWKRPIFSGYITRKKVIFKIKKIELLDSLEEDHDTPIEVNDVGEMTIKKIKNKIQLHWEIELGDEI